MEQNFSELAIMDFLLNVYTSLIMSPFKGGADLELLDVELFDEA